MNRGQVEQVGTPQEIYEYPRSLFVAKFIGSINTIDGEVLEASPTAITVSRGTKRPVTTKPSRDGFRPLPQVTPGLAVRMMIRPEKLKVLKSSPGADQNYVEGTIKEILYKGPLTQLWVTPKDSIGNVLTIIQPNSAASSRRSFGLNDKVFVSWAPEDCFLMGMDGPLPIAEIPASSAALPSVEALNVG